MIPAALRSQPPLPLVTRIAPTPSGYLHPGNLFSFVLTWLLARAYAGKLWLRIDDLDAPRMRPEYLEDLFSTLDWLQLTPDEGPSGPDELRRQWSQHLRLDLYREAVQRLLRQPGTVFACACSRREVRQRSPSGRYPGTCHDRGLAWTSGRVLRLRLPDSPGAAVPDLRWGRLEEEIPDALHDTVLWRREDLPAYQLASVVDDAYFGTTLLVRGADLLPSSGLQCLLAERLSLDVFASARFLHHPLLYESEDIKMSKSHGSLSIRALREAGVSRRALLAWVADNLGLPAADSSDSLAALLESFREGMRLEDLFGKGDDLTRVRLERFSQSRQI